MIERVLVVGSGNVAAFFLSVFKQLGIKTATSSRKNTPELSNQFQAVLVDWSEKRNYPSDLVLLAIADDSIEEVAKEFSEIQAIVAHTSGATSLTFLLESGIKNPAVIYPLQSISAKSLPSVDQVPLMIESAYYDLILFFQKLGFKVQTVNSEERLKYHLAAVLVNNFTNHLFDLADGFLNHNHLSFNHLKPLIQQTVSKLNDLSPFEAQTGPAWRNDSKTIQKHIQLLEDNAGLKSLYEQFTREIRKKSEHEY